jgi:hypothetical protein
MPRIHWKPLVALIVLAIGARWALQYRDATTEPTPPAVTHVDEQESESEDAADPPDSTTVAEPSTDAAAARGALTFDHDPVEVKPRPEDEEITVSFAFTNNSSRPVTVKGLESTCSCLEASLDQRTYAPGARGSGKAVFKVSSFVGRHEKTLYLYTDDPGQSEQVLTFALDVPVVVSIEPNLLEWTVGEPATPKEMVIKMVGADPMRITKVTPTRENVRYELKEVTPGREYRFIVTPTTTADVTIGAFKIETDSKIPKYSRQMAYFSIVRPELAEKKKEAAAEKDVEKEAGK